MRFGATSLQLTSVLAKGLHRLKLRDDVIFSKQVVGGESSFVIKVPEKGGFARFGGYEFELLTLCDGTRTCAEIAEELNLRYPENLVTEQDVREFVDSVEPFIWERSLGEKNLAVLEKIRDERKHRTEGSNLLYFTVAAWDSDRALARVYPFVRWLFTPAFVMFSSILFLFTFLIVVGDYTRIRQDTIEFYNFTHKTAYDLWIFWALLFLISGVHEFGHGLTCKHFGGEVPHMGLLSIYFTPAFFTDCSEMIMFDKTSKRLWTIFAGIWVELTLCSLATLVWYFTPPGSFIGDLGYKTLLLTGVSGVFFNLNPLMKFDGYYALCQYLEMDNLREESFEYLKLWARKYLLFKDVDLPEVTRRKRRIYLSYGISAFLYSTFVLLIIAKFVKNVFTSKFGEGWGYLFTAGVLFLMLRKRLLKWTPSLKAGLRATKEKFMAWQVSRGQQLAGIVLLLLITAVPTAVKTDTEFILEPGARADVRTLAPGWVAQILVHEGQRVEAGAVLATLRNPALEARPIMVRQQLEQAKHALFGAQARNDREEAAKQTLEVHRLQTELATVQAKAAGLVLRSPIAGVIATPQVDQKVGSYIGEGDEFAVVADRSSMKARVLVRDLDLEDVRPGALVKLKVRADPIATYSGYVQQILPAAATDQPIAEPPKPVRHGQELTNYFAVMIRIPNPREELQEGMTGTAKIYGDRYPIAWRVVRNIWRWAHSFFY